LAAIALPCTWWRHSVVRLAAFGRIQHQNAVQAALLRESCNIPLRETSFNKRSEFARSLLSGR
jgi:hypothetical protein